MIMSPSDRRRKVYTHIFGSPNEKSSDELKMHSLIMNNLYDCPDTKYRFYFNWPIVQFGVPTKSVRVQDCRNEFVNFIMDRCMLDRVEAIELMSCIDSPIRTNTLRLDVGKVYGKKLIVGLESNRGTHYLLPDKWTDRPQFARSLFADFVKETEIRKIADFVEINHWSKNINGVGSKDSVAQELAVQEFVTVD